MIPARIADLEITPYTTPPGVRDLAGLFTPLRHAPYAMLLLSGGDLDCSRYSIMGWDPYLVLRSKGRQVELRRGEDRQVREADPFTVLAEVSDAFRLPGPPPLPPFCAGGLGFLAYDLKNHLERLPTTAQDDLVLPEMVWAWHRRLVVHDRVAGTFHQVRVIFEDSSSRACGTPVNDDKVVTGGMSMLTTQRPFQDSSQPATRNAQPATRNPLADPWPALDSPVGDYRVGRLRSNFTREGYLKAVGRIREYIGQGDVYQVNLSQRFSFPFKGEGYYLFQRLFALNPAPFYAYLNCEDFQIFSTSMERFLYRDGDYLETRPIKGTRPRGRDPWEDAALRRELAESLKDDAELSMIVDLLRNDLGKVCRPRSVQVKEHKRLEAYQNVYHLVSIVTGRVRPGLGHVDLIRATFPGGSITGCPKIRAMEIIDELEPTVRHVYCGAIGYLGCHDNLDLNVAIRTGIISQGEGHFAVGGGVVYDSQEEAEYEETLHKGRTLFRLIEGEW